MKTMLHAALVAAALIVPAASFAQANAVAVSTDSAKTFDVFVDTPTGYTFVKMPAGWKFVGAVNKDDVRHLPPDVLTSVIPAQVSQHASTTVRE